MGACVATDYPTSVKLKTKDFELKTKKPFVHSRLDHPGESVSLGYTQEDTNVFASAATLKGVGLEGNVPMMEKAFVKQAKFKSDPIILAALFSGNGPQGHLYAKKCAELLWKSFTVFLDRKSSQDSLQDMDIKKWAYRSLPDLDELLEKEEGINCSNSGAEAIVLVLFKNAITVSNAGRSRGILVHQKNQTPVRVGASHSSEPQRSNLYANSMLEEIKSAKRTTGPKKAAVSKQSQIAPLGVGGVGHERVMMTAEHIATNLEELHRLTQHGARVLRKRDPMFPPLLKDFHVYESDDSNNPGVQYTRCIGQKDLRGLGIVCSPAIFQIKLYLKECHSLILGSNSVFSRCNPDDIMHLSVKYKKLCSKKTFPTPSPHMRRGTKNLLLSEILCIDARNRNIADFAHGTSSVDDSACVVIEFNDKK
eukprot:CAMPEP_0114976374 /NCGR_PEP_ID=MMETSP0216-20121206/2636_1 /TAXON_ID=223996 /ORGANISM="Protocruzia adherens, Strain Boccale" /LENGTH=421 /DNA_ID=CAMNT_0002337293 /DNA_START=55 /DNA_END=1320 /DNA_ORIENTATION=+